MSEFREALSHGPLLADGGIGSYIFELTARLSETSHTYELLNLSNPGLIKGVHLAYLRAGARCITTNTFSANRKSLEAVGMGDKVTEINQAGVQLACEAISEFVGRQAAAPFFVLGSVGPASGDPGPVASADLYREQIEALSGADALLLETFPSLESALAAVKVARTCNPAQPVVLHVALQQRADSGWKTDALGLVREGARLGVTAVGVNCCAPWEAAAFAEAVKDAPEVRSGKVLISAMPNAGGFERIGHRFLSRVTPEYLGRLARTLAASNARLIGGCCEVHPPHIAEMRNYLLSTAHSGRVEPISRSSGIEAAGPTLKAQNGKFSRKLFAREFAVSVELLPPRGTGPRVIDEKIEFVRRLAESGLADAIDITDGSRGIPLMPPGDFAAVIRERLGWNAEAGDGLEIIPHFAARDLNTMGLQSRLIGYNARRIHNVLFVTGDPPKMSPTYPRSSAVFDLDSVGLIRLANASLNAGVDFGGQPLGRQADPRTHFTIGTGFEPEALDREREMEKLDRKLDAGADYIFTQPVFRHGPLDGLMKQVGRGARFFIGVMVLQSVDHARRVAEVPGVVLPDEVIAKLSRYDRLEDQAKAGIEMAAAQIREVRADGWSGVYVMSPTGHEPLLEVLRGGLG